MPILTLLFEHREFITIVILLLAIFFGFEYVKELHSQNAALHAANATLQTDLETSNASIKTLQASINQQNTAVNQLQAAADARVQSHAVEIAAANSKAETYRQQALDILRLKPTTADKCVDANNLINSEILKNGKK